MRVTRYRPLRKDVLEHFGFGTKNMKRFKICPCCGNVQAAKNKFCKVCHTKLRNETLSLIFTGQNTVAVKNAVTCFRMMRSIAPCAERNKIMKERRFDYEEIFVTVYCIYYVDDVFAAYGICGLFRRSELRQLRSLPLGQLLLRKLRPLYGGLHQQRML